MLLDFCSVTSTEFHWTGTITGRRGHLSSLTFTWKHLYYERMKPLFSERLWWSFELQCSCPALPAAAVETPPAPLESLDDTGNGSVESKNGRRPSKSYCLLSVTPFFPLHTQLFHTRNMTAGCGETCTLARSGQRGGTQNCGKSLRGRLWRRRRGRDG